VVISLPRAKELVVARKPGMQRIAPAWRNVFKAGGKGKLKDVFGISR
jgi:hypothetical protein